MAQLRAPIGISRGMIHDMDGLMEDLRFNQKQFRTAEDLLVRMLAMLHKGLAEQKSRGMVTPTGVGGAAWGIPVRRISGAYYEGWKVRRIGPSMWMTYNDSREAFFIEFGINPRSSNAVRRPILKMSSIATLRYIQRTRLIEKFAKATIGSTRNTRGQYRSFMSRMAGSSLLGVVGPSGSLPG
jgi:hypothetical protein